MQNLSNQLPEIKFDNIIREIQECDIEANQYRIEKYELKGFNSMTPNIKTNNKDIKMIKIHSLLKDEFIDPNYLDWNITQKDINEINQLKFGRMKYKECLFNKIFYDDANFTTGKYGNVNLLNCIFFLNSKKEKYFEKIFSKFDIEKGEYEVNLFKKGKKKIMLFDNKIMKGTPFIHCPEKNFWIYLIEKGIALIMKNYINTIPLLSNELFPLLTQAYIEVKSHQVLQRKELYEIIKETLSKNSSYIVFANKKDNLFGFYEKENFISFFITKAFKVNGHRYVEIFMPFNNGVSTKSNIGDEDAKNTKYFPPEKTGDKHYIFLRFDNFHKIFKSTYIVQFNPSFIYSNKTIVLSDRNINLLKIKIETNTKIELSINLPQPFLFRFVLSRLVITENYIRRIRTMYSKDGDQDSNSYYQDEIDYHFEYLSSLYQYNSKGVIKSELESGIYCVLFNVYTNNDIKVNIGCYSENEVEFLDDPEKISEQKLNSQIKSLFISYMKKETNVKKNTIEEDENLIYYESLINENFGYSLYMVENVTENKNAFVSLYTETEGMNLITKDYTQNTTDINIVIPPKNIEIIVFEWEKTINDISIFVDPTFLTKQITPMFNSESFLNLQKNYIAKTSVYYVEIQYRRGVFLIFVNENPTESFIVQMIFDKLINLEYKGLKGDNLEGKNIEIDLPYRSYTSYNLKNIFDEDFSFKISLKISKNKNNVSCKEKISCQSEKSRNKSTGNDIMDSKANEK